MKNERRALLTGATGYIGARLARRLLAEGWEVHAIVRPGSSLVQLGDAADAVHCHAFDGGSERMSAIVGAARPDAVFHLASLFLAQHVPGDVARLVDSNVTFPAQLLEAMAEHGVRRLINTGTAWQHYEDGQYNPVNLYAATKQAFEDVLAYHVQAHGLAATTLVLFDTYGPGDPRGKLIPLLWKTAHAGQPLAMSPGAQAIDLVHVDDVVAAYLRAEALLRERGPGQERYGVSSGRPMRLQDLVAAFEGATGLTVPVEWGARPYRPREVMTPWTRFSPVPGWQPAIPLAAGLAHSVPAGHPPVR